MVKIGEYPLMRCSKHLTTTVGVGDQSRVDNKKYRYMHAKTGRALVYPFEESMKANPFSGRNPSFIGDFIRVLNECICYR